MGKTTESLPVIRVGTHRVLVMRRHMPDVPIYVVTGDGLAEAVDIVWKGGVGGGAIAQSGSTG